MITVEIDVRTLLAVVLTAMIVATLLLESRTTVTRQRTADAERADLDWDRHCDQAKAVTR